MGAHEGCDLAGGVEEAQVGVGGHGANLGQGSAQYADGAVRALSRRRDGVHQPLVLPWRYASRRARMGTAPGE
ncbi:hypothetical protein LF41_929 [Lysobacter dokdonensis DS-58]|uniref:Uncharacterized protein n=1 Tax=Lysobacter dokdonensis DS-58 TaxID=1300345 RepID=A0A0A2WNR9_9GAMM|nr:hypothetical protein LF41_929 [Lysobacter dokdonensis DS-58]